MNAHTPGPWTVDNRLATYSIREAKGSVEDKANARLIAAAPEILEALEALVVFVKWHSEKRHLPVHMNTPNTGALMLAMDAIAKATGGAK